MAIAYHWMLIRTVARYHGATSIWWTFFRIALKLTHENNMWGVFWVFKIYVLWLALLYCMPGYFRAESRFVPSQWVMALLSNDVSRWLGASLESALLLNTVQQWHTISIIDYKQSKTRLCTTNFTPFKVEWENMCNITPQETHLMNKYQLHKRKLINIHIQSIFQNHICMCAACIIHKLCNTNCVQNRN